MQGRRSPEKDLSGRKAQSGIDDFAIRVLGATVQGFAELVGFESFCAFRRGGTRETTAGQRTSRNHRDSFRLAKTHHLPLFFAADEVVMVLHGDEAGPSVDVCKVKRFGKLPG